MIAKDRSTASSERRRTTAWERRERQRAREMALAGRKIALARARAAKKETK
jgi:hypothetical protein